MWTTARPAFFCEWAGKHVCGAVAGTDPTAVSSRADNDEWVAACSRNGSRTYAYGSAYQAGYCNDNNPSGGPVPVKSLPNCEGGFAGLFDMSGNVQEWENWCDDAGSICQIRGGTFASMPVDAGNSQDDGLSCAPGGVFHPQWTWSDKSTGFRCCSDRLP